jgi:glyoxylate/hydroxypyruvate reductase A
MAMNLDQLVLLNSTREDEAQWQTCLQGLMPDFTIVRYEDLQGLNVDPASIKWLVTAFPKTGLLKELTGLKAICSLWAGVEHLTQDPDLSADMPILRMVDDGLTKGMVEYVVGHVFRHHLDMPNQCANQARKSWSPKTPPLANDRSVVILGLGVLGAACAQSLAMLGFQVSGWSRSAKNIPNVNCENGADGLDICLRKADILVCLLPHTSETEGLLNKETFYKMPSGAALINPARGVHIIDKDLIEALANGQISAASLDVFDVEPLPENHVFWSHDKIMVTPHIASTTRMETAAIGVAANIKHLHAGGDISELPGLMQRDLGY